MIHIMAFAPKNVAILIMGARLEKTSSHTSARDAEFKGRLRVDELEREVMSLQR